MSLFFLSVGELVSSRWDSDVELAGRVLAALWPHWPRMGGYHSFLFECDATTVPGVLARPGLPTLNVYLPPFLHCPDTPQKVVNTLDADGSMLVVPDLLHAPTLDGNNLMLENRRALRQRREEKEDSQRVRGAV